MEEKMAKQSLGQENLRKQDYKLEDFGGGSSFLRNI